MLLLLLDKMLDAVCALIETAMAAVSARVN